MSGLNRRQLGLLMGAGLILPTAAGAAPRTWKVEIHRFAFKIKELEIKAGDTIEWINLDAAPHTATADDGEWDTGELGKNDSGSITFADAGEFPYYCVFHPHMKASITVTA